jgi:hypothetical protein
MSGTRNSSRVDACALQNEQASWGHWLTPWSMCEKFLSGALRSQHIAYAGIVDSSVKCLSHSAQTSLCKRILAAAVAALNHNLCFQFCMNFQQRLEEDKFAEKPVFSDEVTFYVCSKVNHHNVHIWGTENSHGTVEHICDSPKVNVFFAVSSCKV